MKKLTCKDLGGPCDAEITGSTFEEVGKNSQYHVTNEIKKGDAAHVAAVEKWKNMSAEERKEAMDGLKKAYDDAEEV